MWKTENNYQSGKFSHMLHDGLIPVLSNDSSCVGQATLIEIRLLLVAMHPNLLSYVLELDASNSYNSANVGSRPFVITLPIVLTPFTCNSGGTSLQCLQGFLES